MTEYNPGQPTAGEIVVDDVNGTITVDGDVFPWNINSGMMQLGHLQGEPPFVRFHVPAALVRRITSQGETVYEEPNEPFFDPDFEPDIEE